MYGSEPLNNQVSKFPFSSSSKSLKGYEIIETKGDILFYVVISNFHHQGDTIFNYHSNSKFLLHSWKKTTQNMIHSKSNLAYNTNHPLLYIRLLFLNAPSLWKTHIYNHPLTDTIAFAFLGSSMIW